LVINAARKKPAQRHQLDHTIHRAKLRSVDSTAASLHQNDPRAVDATAVSKQTAKFAAVAIGNFANRRS
jgi:hypothetical protein